MKNIDVQQLAAQFPLVQSLIALEPVTWFNPNTTTLAAGLPYVGLDNNNVADASARLARFAPYMCEVSPEPRTRNGLLGSGIAAFPAMQATLNQRYGVEVTGRLLLKKDSHLPISGSIKARGGIYEVLTHAEQLAIKAGLLREEDDYRKLFSDEFRQFFSQHSIAVGSTGNLGMSIGIMSAKLGFTVTVHMSADAREWKKRKLREHGAIVVEYAEDYGVAVEQGRKEAERDPNCFFIDDENSRTLFLGYSVAGERVKKQFDQMGIKVDADHPLFVYLPCGVGGGPGGVAFGLKLAFGDIDNLTAADGLAVGRASGFVGRAMERLLAGFYTLSDQEMYDLLGLLARDEQIKLEPSALAGMAGPWRVAADPAWQTAQGLDAATMARATHLVWATGGGMVPAEEMAKYLASAKI